ncbi:MAG: efflux RND transporter periplasmic adaptor subunit [Pseudomarimonas sp.]
MTHLHTGSLPRLLALTTLLLFPVLTAAAVKTRALAEIAELAQGQASAQVLSPNDSLLSAELSAVVSAVHADVGASVRRGELLIELDASDARLALAQADALLAAAKSNLDMAAQRLARAKQLREQHYASADDLLARGTEEQAARSEVAVREAARKVAARSVEKARIVAPFAGVVIERHAQRGALAGIGSPLLRIVDLAAPEVQVALQAGDARGIEKASALRFESQGQSWPLRLLRLSPVADSSTRTQVARFAFVDAPATAGLAGLLRWQGPQRLLPAELMVQRGEQRGAFVVVDGFARFIAATDAQQGRSFAIDLPDSAQIVVDGQQALSDGEPVTVDSTP